jgi:hypothetical protein
MAPAKMTRAALTAKALVAMAAKRLVRRGCHLRRCIHHHVEADMQQS